MSLDLQNFIIPKNSTEGLYKIAEQMQQQKAAQAKAAKDAATQKAIGGRFAASLFDNKNLYTGTPLDPEANKILAQGKKETFSALNDGADFLQAQMIAAPYKDKYNEYITTAKNYNAAKNEISKNIDKGIYAGTIDKNALFSELEKKYFIRNENGDLDYEKISQNDIFQLSDEILKTQPIYTQKAVDNFVDKSAVQNRYVTVNERNAKGGYTKVDKKITVPFYAVEDVDNNGVLKVDNGSGGFKIRSEKAVDGDTELLHSFGEQKGKNILLVPDDVYEAAKKYPLGRKVEIEVNKMIAEHPELAAKATPESLKNLYKAELYTQLSSHSGIKGTHKYLKDTQDDTLETKKYLIDYAANAKAKAASKYNQLQEGNLFDNQNTTITYYPSNPLNGGAIPSVPLTGVIEEGVAKDRIGGTPLKNITVVAPKSNLTENLINTLSKRSVYLDDNVKFNIGDNGEIKELPTSRNGIVTRLDMENNQKERVGGKVKSTQVFGTRQSAKQAPKQAVSNKKPNKHGI